MLILDTTYEFTLLIYFENNTGSPIIQWISLTGEVTVMLYLTAIWIKIPTRREKHPGTCQFLMSTTKVWLYWSLHIGDALYSPLLFHMDMGAEGGGGKKRRDICTKQNTVFHWERNLQDQWHKCEFWTKLISGFVCFVFVFKKKENCALEAYDLLGSRWPLVCPCVRPSVCRNRRLRCLSDGGTLFATQQVSLLYL